MAADYSQIELRIIASLSNEENMINAFKKTKTFMPQQPPQFLMFQ